MRISDGSSDVCSSDLLEVFVTDNVDTDGAQPTHVVFFECKDHGRPVEVSKVDEVVGRLAGGYGFSMKAYMVTRGSFQSGALNTAKNNGIGLIKLMPDDKVKFFAHMVTMDSMERDRLEFPRRANVALLSPNYDSDGESFYAIDNGFVFRSWEGMLDKHFRAIGIPSAF